MRRIIENCALKTQSNIAKIGVSSNESIGQQLKLNLLES